MAHRSAADIETVASKEANGTILAGRRLLLDSNIWVKEVGLMSQRASTLRLYMLECNVKLVRLEVIQSEVRRHISELIRRDIVRARQAHDKLLRLFGKLQQWRIPTDNEVEARATELANGLDLDIESLPLLPETALFAAKRCIDGRSPAGQAGRDFVDCLIWEEALKILDSHDLIFVTNDNGFFEEKNTYDIDADLKHEAEERSHDVSIFRDLESILSPFRENYEFPTSGLIDFIDQQTDSLRSAAASLGFYPASRLDLNYYAFATEKTGIIEVRFDAVTPYLDGFSLGRATKGLEIDGTALYSAKGGKFDDIALNRILIAYMDIDGQQKSVPGSAVYARLEPLVLGAPVFWSDRRDLIDAR